MIALIGEGSFCVAGRVESGDFFSLRMEYAIDGQLMSQMRVLYPVWRQAGRVGRPRRVDLQTGIWMEM